MLKEFIKGYYCDSIYWRTCQLDCSDCGHLYKKDWAGLNGEAIKGKGEK